MVLWNIVVVVFLCCSQELAFGGDIVSEIRSIIGDVCPGNNVCSRNTTAVHRTLTQLKSCCTECSCEDHCGLINNCCFPGTDHVNNRNRAYQTCKYVRVPEPVNGESNLYETYYMFTEPPPTGCIGDDAILTQSEKEKNDESSEIAPVSSKNSGQIYLNRELALCHGERQVIPWVAYFSCNGFDEENVMNLDIGSLVEEAFTTHRTPFCWVRYRYPGDQRDLISKRCYKDVIDTCPNNASFAIPPDINWHREDIVKACESGFYSPLENTVDYANVFCHICNGKPFLKNTSCFVDPSIRDGGIGLYALLNMDLVRYSRETNGKRDVPMACLQTTLQLGGCRAILCPEGQLRVSKGTCDLLFTSMGSADFDVILRLVPRLPIPVPDVDNAELIPRWLTSPWANSWAIESVFFEVRPKKSVLLTELFVKQQLIGKRGTLENILKNMERVLKKPFTISLGNNSVEADQTMAGFKKTRVWDKEGMQVVTDSEPGQYTIVQRNVSLLFNGMYVLSKVSFPITKMFFCEQVELEDHEYIIDEKRVALTYTGNNRSFASAEFSLVSTAGGRLVARICLEDSGLIPHDARGDALSVFDKDTITFTTLTLPLLSWLIAISF